MSGLQGTEAESSRASSSSSLPDSRFNVFVRGIRLLPFWFLFSVFELGVRWTNTIQSSVCRDSVGVSSLKRLKELIRSGVFATVSLQRSVDYWLQSLVSHRPSQAKQSSSVLQTLLAFGQQSLSLDSESRVRTRLLH